MYIYIFIYIYIYIPPLFPHVAQSDLLGPVAVQVCLDQLEIKVGLLNQEV